MQMQKHWVVQGFDGYWGRGLSLDEACKHAREAGSRLRCYLVHEVTQPANKDAPWIDGVGGLWHYAERDTGSVVTTVVDKRRK